MRYFKKVVGLSLLGILPMMVHADEGETVYLKGGEEPTALACITCHGSDGEGLAVAGYPSIAGKSSAYLTKQLYDFQEGSRTHPIMDGIANSLSDDEIEAVTFYMESMPVTDVPMITRAETPDDLGAQLALRGDWSRNIPECVACHGPSGIGVGEAFPKLANQSSVYIVNQLKAWKTGTRKNDQADLMGHIARAMTEEEMQSVANYFSTIGQKGE